VKIADVKVSLCEGHTDRLRWVFVHVETDAGVVGVGDASNWPHGEVIARTIESFKDVVIGEGPFDIENPYNKMYWSLIPFGPGGVVISAIARIKTACWDIIGQVTNQPIYNLIGRRVCETIRLFGIGRAPRFRTWALPDSRVGDESGLWSRLSPLDCDEESKMRAGPWNRLHRVEVRSQTARGHPHAHPRSPPHRPGDPRHRRARCGHRGRPRQRRGH
jgi:L-alanine-DL-glutamate epimerase-like enolase superfamily enzyme